MAEIDLNLGGKKPKPQTEEKALVHHWAHGCPKLQKESLCTPEVVTGKGWPLKS